jgi:hypothetical protein
MGGFGLADKKVGSFGFKDFEQFTVVFINFTYQDSPVTHPVDQTIDAVGPGQAANADEPDLGGGKEGFSDFADRFPGQPPTFSNQRFQQSVYKCRQDAQNKTLSFLSILSILMDKACSLNKSAPPHVLLFPCYRPPNSVYLTAGRMWGNTTKHRRRQ